MIRVLQVVAFPITSIFFLKIEICREYFHPFGSFSQVFGPFQGVAYARTEQNNKSVAFSCVPNCFYFVL